MQAKSWNVYWILHNRIAEEYPDILDKAKGCQFRIVDKEVHMRFMCEMVDYKVVADLKDLEECELKVTSTFSHSKPGKA